MFGNLIQYFTSMYSEAKKLHIIEEVLKIDNEAILMELEAVLNKTHGSDIKLKMSAHDFSGIWSKEEAEEIERIIEESCETINPDDWK